MSIIETIAGVVYVVGKRGSARTQSVLIAGARQGINPALLTIAIGIGIRAGFITVENEDDFEKQAIKLTERGIELYDKMIEHSPNLALGDQAPDSVEKN